MVFKYAECKLSISQICTYHIFLESWRQDESIEGSNSFFQKKIFFSDPFKKTLKFSSEKSQTLDPLRFSNTPSKVFKYIYFLVDLVELILNIPNMCEKSKIFFKTLFFCIFDALYLGQFYIFVKKKLYTYFSLAEIYKMTYRMWVLVKKSNFRIYPQIGLLDPSPDSDLHLKVTFPTSDEPMRSDWLSNETMCTSPALQSQ